MPKYMTILNFEEMHKKAPRDVGALNKNRMKINYLLGCGVYRK